MRRWLEALIQDIQWAVRQIGRAPGFSATVVGILALGVGANTAVFSVVHHLLIAPLPFADGNRMVLLRTTDRAGRILADPPVALQASWRARARTVESAVGLHRVRFVVGDSSRGPTETMFGAAVPANLTEFLNERPLYGRLIAAHDTMPDAPPVAVIGEALWRRTFGESRTIIGQPIVLNGVSHTVIGVVSKRFVIPFVDVEDVFVPLHRAGDSADDTMAKLRHGVSIDDANREIAQMFPAKSDLNPFDAPPFLDREIDMISSGTKELLFMFFGAVSVILLIASANVANLLLARSWSRQREFAVRVALGAGRGRILRQVLAESSMLALAASALSLGIAYVVMKAIVALMPGMLSEIRLERAVLLWSLAIAQLAGLTFGLIPAFTAASANVGESLKAGARSATGSSFAKRIRAGLVIGEMALSVVLLVGAGLIVRTLVALNRVDVGFQSNGLASIKVRLGAKTFPDASSRAAALHSVLDAVRATPGVRGATYATGSPPDFNLGMFTLSVDGRASGIDSLKTFAAVAIAPDYFALTGIPIIAGRTFSPDASPDSIASSDAIIINERFARSIWPNGNALGARLRQVAGGPPTPWPLKIGWTTVVGIVGDVRFPGQKDGRFGTGYQVYTRTIRGPQTTTLIVRSSLSPASLRQEVNRVLRNVSSDITISTPLRTADDLLSEGAHEQRVVLELIGSFAVLAVILAAVGLHAVIAYSVGQRVREIGVRIALGATGSDIARLILRQGLFLAAGGAVVGILTATAATRTLQSLLYGVTTSDPITLAVVGFSLLIIAAVATYAPARRAARLDPVTALRAD